VLPPEESRVALRKLFQQRRVADLPLLLKTLRTDAPRSVFRRLSLVGYVSGRGLAFMQGPDAVLPARGRRVATSLRAGLASREHLPREQLLDRPDVVRDAGRHGG